MLIYDEKFMAIISMYIEFDWSFCAVKKKGG